ncbi:hypothetical protein AC579_9074 [Pseudocercospora musae]|uniref:Uncharacterized protein n=1 Tax=Pseudocercospora musae TaxID=113226 RepID=A0A139IFH5_9PEZI|nr:hypothetical protein AC579_9074 [Pseudocercospora musae]
MISRHWRNKVLPSAKMTRKLNGFDINNNHLGQGKGGRAGQGNIIETAIDQAVCVSCISVKQSDGSPSGARSRNIGRYCGWKGYHGNQQAGNYEDGPPHSPKFSWLDADHENDTASAALKFRTGAYGEEAKDIISAQDLCNSDTSYGPDLIEGEGNFCPIETKTLTAVCNGNHFEQCVDFDPDTSESNMRSSVARRSTSVVHKPYDSVRNW